MHNKSADALHAYGWGWVRIGVITIPDYCE